MKNEILDDGFIEDLRWSLEPGEKIIWEGRPHVRFMASHPFKDVKFEFEDLFGAAIISFGFLFILIPIVIYLIYLGGIPRYLTLFLIGFFLLIRGSAIIKRKKTKYTITSQRIIFQLWKMGEGETLHIIPFSKIKNIAITEESDNNGVIYLGLKDPSSILFETEHIIDGDKRHQPTLEFIDDVKEVGQYIQQGIIGKL